MFSLLTMPGYFRPQYTASMTIGTPAVSPSFATLAAIDQQAATTHLPRFYGECRDGFSANSSSRATTPSSIGAQAGGLLGTAFTSWPISTMAMGRCHRPIPCHAISMTPMMKRQRYAGTWLISAILSASIWPPPHFAGTKGGIRT